MDLSAEEVETELADLTQLSLAALRDCDRSQFSASLQRMLQQIDSARANIGGGSAPPATRID